MGLNTNHAALRRASQVRIREHLAEAGPQTAEEIGRALAVLVRTVTRHLQHSVWFERCEGGWRLSPYGEDNVGQP